MQKINEKTDYFRTKVTELMEEGGDLDGLGSEDREKKIDEMVKNSMDNEWME